MAKTLTGFVTVWLLATAGQAFTARELWELWPHERFVTTAAPCLRHAELQQSLTALADQFPEAVSVEEVGQSFEGRPIRMLTVGSGENRVLLWSQMHGNEPSATPALLDLARYLLTHREEPGPRAILDRLTLLMIPMLNPDGSELYVRRNAQAIDINRDALNLATPEGRILKAVRDEHRPMLGFNLHDQNRRKAVGDTGRLSTNAVLAVAGDPELTLTPGRMRAKRACSAIVTTLAPFMPGNMARYDEDWSPRAFGDNLTAWGTPVVLIESGGLPQGHEITDLTRLNFVALLTVLRDLAENDLADHDPEIYESLPRTRNDAWAEVVVRNGFLLQPGTSSPYRSDLAFYLFQSDRLEAGCAVESRVGSMVFELGDARFLGAGREIDGTDTLLVTPFVVGADGWSARRWLSEPTLAELSEMGVGTVRWSVGSRKTEAAEAVARQLNDTGHARVLVVPGRAALPPVVLERAPEVRGSGRLVDLLATLGAIDSERGASDADLFEALQSLWPDGMAEGLPGLRPGQAASFLMLGPAAEGRLSSETAVLRAVWLDGHRIDSGGPTEVP